MDLPEADPPEDLIEIEIAYCGREDQTVLRIRVAQGTTLGQAIRRSGLLERYPEIDLAVNRVGVYGVLRGLSDAVDPGDRIEVYRPLSADPKNARRKRAAGRR